MIPHYSLNQTGTEVIKIDRTGAEVFIPPSRAEYKDKRTLVLLDRDGVVTTKPRAHTYCISKKMVQLLPMAGEAIAYLNAKKILVALITNQPGLGKGIFSTKELLEMSEELSAQLKPLDAHIDAVFFCPHVKAESLANGCTCRKPAPGMVSLAEQVYRVTPEQTFVFGDFESDIAAAKNAGAHPVYIQTEHDESNDHATRIREKHSDVFTQNRYPNLLYAVKALFS